MILIKMMTRNSLFRVVFLGAPRGRREGISGKEGKTACSRFLTNCLTEKAFLSFFSLHVPCITKSLLVLLILGRLLWPFKMSKRKAGGDSPEIPSLNILTEFCEGLLGQVRSEYYH